MFGLHSLLTPRTIQADPQLVYIATASLESRELQESTSAVDLLH